MSGHVSGQDEGDDCLEIYEQWLLETFLISTSSDYSAELERETSESTTSTTSHLSDLFESIKIHICKDIALGERKDLEGNGTVMVLQGRYVVVAHCQLCASIDLVPDRRMAHRWLNWLSCPPNLPRPEKTPLPKLCLQDKLNQCVFIPEPSPRWTTFTVHWHQCCEESVKTCWGQ